MLNLIKHIAKTASPILTGMLPGLGILGLELGVHGLITQFGIPPNSIQPLIDCLTYDDSFYGIRPHTVIVSTGAVIYGIYKRDWEGLGQWLATQLIVAGTSEVLKHAVNRTRPNGGKKSFPSSHTSGAFVGAAYVHHRYGIAPAIPAYFVASFVGCTRVYHNAHHISDVVAGAGLAILTSYNAVSPAAISTTISPKLRLN